LVGCDESAHGRIILHPAHFAVFDASCPTRSCSSSRAMKGGRIRGRDGRARSARGQVGWAVRPEAPERGWPMEQAVRTAVTARL
jgi:hypothetical protein